MAFKDKDISDDSSCTKINIRIVGFGNKYRSDDGIGIKVIEELEKIDFFKDVEIIDGGTSGTDLIFLAKGCRKIIIVDAIDTGTHTEEVLCVHVDDVEEFIKKDCKSLSLHDLNLSDILRLIKALGIDTDISIIGVKPKNINFGEKLSPEIENKIPQIISRIKEEINKVNI